MIDLHLHTKYSDGEHTPSEIIKIAKDSGVNTVSITDHDSVSGISTAISEGKKYGVRVIPGIEITAFDEVEVHILGYNIDFNSDKIRAYETKIKNERRLEISRIFEYFKSLDIELLEDDVFKFRDGEIVTIWHFAMALFEKGYAKSIKEALEKFFYGSELKKLLTTSKISVKEAIELILDTGGVPILAHPGRLGFSYDRLIGKIKEWKNIGLAGIEAIYSLNSSKENEMFLSLAKELDFVATIGSDYHGEHVKPSIKIGTGVNGSMEKYCDCLDVLEYLK